jgi:hypothetical protein
MPRREIPVVREAMEYIFKNRADSVLVCRKCHKRLKGSELNYELIDVDYLESRSLMFWIKCSAGHQLMKCSLAQDDLLDVQDREPWLGVSP